MNDLLTISSILGVAGLIASFLLFFILREMGFSEGVIQTFLFLKLIIAGHSTVYITRSESWFWKRPFPSPLLFGATFGTEILGTIIAVYGLLVTPIGWLYALFIWGYSLAWFFVNDAIKILTHKILLQKS
jgi:H+-transporting ATPase